ncbi:hypothetical protein [Pseudofrankia asymbiotica]|uniref:Uncharacterized protein n=1 Tax=Pseudofrankia asymbiotica TaxID=1834516 RepID=A0A1V2IAN9_9ACTN|nr:hypothetical protein [Pseudofrankia asymbiotica]ONH29491.1 hypothetical protein BL253_16605 [Pseudofrankia asymbiotica]
MGEPEYSLRDVDWWPFWWAAALGACLVMAVFLVLYVPLAGKPDDPTVWGPQSDDALVLGLAVLGLPVVAGAVLSTILVRVFAPVRGLPPFLQACAGLAVEVALVALLRFAASGH